MLQKNVSIFLSSLINLLSADFTFDRKSKISHSYEHIYKKGHRIFIATSIQKTLFKYTYILSLHICKI